MAIQSSGTVRFARPTHMADAVLLGADSLGVTPNTLVANLARGGQLGSGIRFTKLDAATPLAFSPVVLVVTQCPTMWDAYPKLQEMLKAMFETHASEVTGIDITYTLQTDDTPAGHDSQMLKTPTQSARSPIAPNATYREVTGNIVHNLHRTWIFDIQHPDTNASILPANITDEDQIPVWVFSAFSMSFVAIQYDPTGLPDRIIDAAFYTNVFPTDIDVLGFQRVINSTQLRNRSITYTGIVQHNENTRELGVQIAKMLQLHRINYNFALPGIAGSIDPSIAIDENISNFGGINYEANGNPEAGVEGAVTQFAELGDSHYADRMDGNSAPITPTGAAAANRSE